MVCGRGGYRIVPLRGIERGRAPADGGQILYPGDDRSLLDAFRWLTAAPCGRRQRWKTRLINYN
jgi:hypothetical protein